MDGIIAYILSKKYTNDTVIGMGAIKGAACQVQSINKVNKTTTITLEWEDNLGTSHTQSFDIEDGLDGVSVIGATIKPNGHLELTLSNSTTIDCGQVLPQYDTMPTPSASNEGQILQYIGTTTSSYTNGYFYQCINDGGVYKWVEKSVQDSYTKGQIGSLSDLPDTSKNVIENIANIKLSVDQLSASKLSISDIDNALSDVSENPVQNKVIKLTLDQLRGSILDKLNEKEDKFRYSTMPTASVDYLNKIVEYIGTTDSTYTNGYFYQCRFDGINYSWVQKNIQPSSGGTGGDGVVDGYYNSTDHLFYEENTFINPITGDDNTLYVSLDTNLLYRYNGLIFIRVDESSSGEDDVINGYYNTTDGKFYEDSTYTTEIVGQIGKIYISIDTNIQYRWDNLSLPNKFVTISSSIAVDSALSDTSENPVQNKVITVPLQALQGSVLTKMQKMLSAQQDNFAVFDNGGQVVDSNISKDIVPSSASSSNKLLVKSDIDNALSNTSENPVQNKVITVPLQALQGSMADKANKVSGATVNNFAGLDANGDLIDSGINKDIVPSGASSSNQLVTANDISTLSDKANKVTSATNGDIATLDSNGDLTDSGFSKDIIPNTATTSNKLVTNSDLPTELNDLSDDVVITSPVNNQILAYNSTSGKWENKTGQETIGGIVFKGSILFANLPTTGMANGDAYDIKDAFTTDNRFEEGSGISCGAGTDVVWVESESKWNILTPAGVYSFNGRTGAVSPATSDYDADQVDYDNTTSGLTATNVQAAIDEVVNEKADKVSSATSGHLAGLDGNGNLTDSGVVASNVIEKVTTATGLLKDDGTVDTTSYAPSANAYLVGDTAETTIDDTDYFPFYDSSATGKRKTLFSSIVNKLKNTFATLVTGTFTAGNLVSLDSSGNIADSGKKASDFVGTSDIYKSIKVNNTGAQGSTPKYIKIENAYPTSVVNALVYNISAGYGDSEILTLSTKDDNTRQTPVLNLITRTNVSRLSGLKYDTNGDIYIGISAYTTATVTQIAGTTIANFSVSLVAVGDLPSTVTDGIIINSVNKIDKVSTAIQNDIAIFDANGGVADSNVLISSLPTIAPTPASGLTEKDVVDEVNSATATNANAPSLYGVQKYSNEKKVRRVLNGANIPSGTSMTATGIGTWTDKTIDQITSSDEADWWYDSAFVVPVYYMLTSDTSIVTGKTYYTRSGTAPNYTYTVVASPVVADIGTYYEQYSDDIELSFKFDPSSGEPTALGGYILDTTTGKLCIKFANSITPLKARIAVDITYTRNEVV